MANEITTTNLPLILKYGVSANMIEAMEEEIERLAEYYKKPKSKFKGIFEVYEYKGEWKAYAKVVYQGDIRKK